MASSRLKSLQSTRIVESDRVSLPEMERLGAARVRTSKHFSVSSLGNNPKTRIWRSHLYRYGLDSARSANRARTQSEMKTDFPPSGAIALDLAFIVTSYQAT